MKALAGEASLASDAVEDDFSQFKQLRAACPKLSRLFQSLTNTATFGNGQKIVR